MWGKGKGWTPVAIWLDGNGHLVARRGDHMVDPWQVWRPGLQAISEQAYRDKRAGKLLPGEYRTASGDVTTDPSRAVAIRPRRQNGHQEG